MSLDPKQFPTEASRLLEQYRIKLGLNKSRLHRLVGSKLGRDPVQVRRWHMGAAEPYADNLAALKALVDEDHQAAPPPPQQMVANMGAEDRLYQLTVQVKLAQEDIGVLREGLRMARAEIELLMEDKKKLLDLHEQLRSDLEDLRAKAQIKKAS